MKFTGQKPKTGHPSPRCDSGDLLWNLQGAQVEIFCTCFSGETIEKQEKSATASLWSHIVLIVRNEWDTTEISFPIFVSTGCSCCSMYAAILISFCLKLSTFSAAHSADFASAFSIHTAFSQEMHFSNFCMIYTWIKKYVHTSQLLYILLLIWSQHTLCSASWNWWRFYWLWSDEFYSFEQFFITSPYKSD